MIGMVTAVEPTMDIVDLPFDDYIVKPVDRETLLDLLKHLFYGRNTIM